MVNQKILSCVLGICLIAIALPMQADRYKVLAVNGFGNIYIGKDKVPAQKGVIFDQTEEIHWSNKNQSMRIKNIDKEEANLFCTICASDVVKVEKPTLQDHLLRMGLLATKGAGNKLRQDTLSLLDSLVIPTNFFVGEPCEFNATWIDGTDTIRYRLSESQYNGKRMLEITPQIFRGRRPKLIEVHIMKTDRRGTYRERRVWIKRIPFSPEDE